VRGRADPVRRHRRCGRGYAARGSGDRTDGPRGGPAVGRRDDAADPPPRPHGLPRLQRLPRRRRPAGPEPRPAGDDPDRQLPPGLPLRGHFPPGGGELHEPLSVPDAPPAPRGERLGGRRRPGEATRDPGTEHRDAPEAGPREGSGAAQDGGVVRVGLEHTLPLSPTAIVVTTAFARSSDESERDPDDQCWPMWPGGRLLQPTATPGSTGSGSKPPP